MNNIFPINDEGREKNQLLPEWVNNTYISYQLSLQSQKLVQPHEISQNDGERVDYLTFLQDQRNKIFQLEKLVQDCHEYKHKIQLEIKETKAQFEEYIQRFRKYFDIIIGGISDQVNKYTEISIERDILDPKWKTYPYPIHTMQEELIKKYQESLKQFREIIIPYNQMSDLQRGGTLLTKPAFILTDKRNLIYEMFKQMLKEQEAYIENLCTVNVKQALSLDELNTKINLANTPNEQRKNYRAKIYEQTQINPNQKIEDLIQTKFSDKNKLFDHPRELSKPQHIGGGFYAQEHQALAHNSEAYPIQMNQNQIMRSGGLFENSKQEVSSEIKEEEMNNQEVQQESPIKQEVKEEEEVKKGQEAGLQGLGFQKRSVKMQELGKGHLWNYYGRKLKEIFSANDQYKEHLKDFKQYKKQDFIDMFVVDPKDTQRTQLIKKAMCKQMSTMLKNPQSVDTMFSSYKYKDFLVKEENIQTILKLISRSLS